MENIAYAWLTFCAYALVSITLVVPLVALVDRWIERRRERKNINKLVVWK